MPKLVLLLEDGATRDILLDKERITLGRRADNDVCLPHPAVSGEHAAVVTVRSDSFLEDLGSTNGTLVNGEMVQKHFLRDGDTLELGRQRFVYLADEDARPTVIHAAQPARPGAELTPDQGAPSLPTQWDRGPRAEPAQSGTPPRASAPVAQPPRNGASRDWTEMGAANEWPHSSGKAAGAHVQTDVPAELMVLTGPSAGRTLALIKEITSVGRAGVQVAIIRRTPRGHLVTAGEGSRPPLLNGNAVEPGGALLAPGDVMEVAGARIQFSAPPDLPT
ncbi:MAG: FHA domain-containing protein [Pseudomonadota bacterium]|nr:FHA domain-containing protein [Pseudomonadota bacterium]